jgi:hypothetical protein
MKNVPGSAGVHTRVCEFDELHPSGSPTYEKLYGRSPPDAFTVRVDEFPMVMTLGVAVNAVIAGLPAPTTRSRLALAILPSTSVTVTPTAYVPYWFGVHASEDAFPLLQPGGRVE